MSNGNGNGSKGRKFWALMFSEILTSAFAIMLAFKLPSADMITLAQFFIGYQALVTSGYIGFNVAQKKWTDAIPKQT